MTPATLDPLFPFDAYAADAIVASIPDVVSGRESYMRHVLSVALALLLAACGLETAGTAATAGVAKKQEIEQGRKTMDQAASRAAASLDQSQNRLREADK